jgi:hypothetical protein
VQRLQATFLRATFAGDVFDNTNGMSNVKRLGQECWLVDNVKFASGQRSCCQKRHLLKISNSPYHTYNITTLTSQQHIWSAIVSVDMKNHRWLLANQKS